MPPVGDWRELIWCQRAYGFPNTSAPQFHNWRRFPNKETITYIQRDSTEFRQQKKEEVKNVQEKYMKKKINDGWQTSRLYLSTLFCWGLINFLFCNLFLLVYSSAIFMAMTWSNQYGFLEKIWSIWLEFAGTMIDILNYIVRWEQIR